MPRVLTFIYGAASYTLTLGVSLYIVGFLANFAVPKGIDSGADGPLGRAIFVNVLLVGLFGIQHSTMARPTFKKWWTQRIPEPMERSTYALASNFALIGLFWLWQPMSGVLWDVQNPVGRMLVYSLFVCGLMAILVTTFLINHFDLFGLRQAWLYLRGKEYSSLGFVTPGPYRRIRHPLYVGWMTAIWAAPTMTAGHLLFALGMTAYIFVGIWLEERNLIEQFGETYANYRRQTPMFIPRLFKKPAANSRTPQ